jgi:hypothetical protein
MDKDVKLVFMGAFLSRYEAEAFREISLSGFEEGIKNGELILLEDDIKLINTHHVVRILAANPQKELPLE